MILFLDTSVLLAASGSASGASRYVCRNGAGRGWALATSGYCLQETLRNLSKIGPAAAAAWECEINPVLHLVPDAFSTGATALVFPKTKDRPVVISALAANAVVLLTLDRADFQGVLGGEIYGMKIRTPAAFLTEQRSLTVE